jgi:RNA polymerase sigma factor (sigma-70 family)
MEALLREHRGLVWWMVNRQGSGKADFVDLFQEGRIGLWQAILQYDPERGVAFSSYACVVIVHQVWVAVRHSLKALAAPMLWDVGAFDAMLLLQVIMLYYSTRRIYD